MVLFIFITSIYSTQHKTQRLTDMLTSHTPKARQQLMCVAGYGEIVQ